MRYSILGQLWEPNEQSHAVGETEKREAMMEDTIPFPDVREQPVAWKDTEFHTAQN
jgi:hypothetical protein